jgi:hypothetical protein
MMLEFTSDVDTDMTLHVLEGPQMGRAVLYVDGQYYAESDTSYPVQAIAHMQYNGAPAGSHRISVITTDVAGYNTTTDTPVFALDGVDLYEWSDVVYTTSVEYEEVDPTTWNKVDIRPDKTNTKASGVPAITAENVPVKYRARVRFDKPDGDPYSASVLVTDVQAEVGFNESFTRINYGPASFPAAMIQPYNGAVVGTGITAQHLQEYNPGFHTKETGVQERHLADGSVTTYKLGNSAVTADKIASGNISYEKLATSGKVKLQMNVALADYDYPIILPTNIDPAVRYIPCDVDAGSEDIYVNGQQQYPDEDYTVTRVVAAQRMDDVTKVQYATKITFLRPISATDKVWATYWQPI